MKIRYLLISVAIILLSSLENFSFNTSVKNYTKCVGENVCINIKYKIRDGNFHYKVFVFPGRRNVKMKEREKFIKNVENNKKFNDSDELESYFKKGIRQDKMLQFYNYLRDKKPITIDLEDKDNFNIKRIKVDFITSDSNVNYMSNDDINNYKGLTTEGVSTLTKKETKDFHDINFKTSLSLEEESSKLYW